MRDCTGIWCSCLQGAFALELQQAACSAPRPPLANIHNALIYGTCIQLRCFALRLQIQEAGSYGHGPFHRAAAGGAAAPFKFAKSSLKSAPNSNISRCFSAPVCCIRRWQSKRCATCTAALALLPSFNRKSRHSPHTVCLHL